MSYATDVCGEIETLSKDQAVMNDLSPAARATLGAVQFAIHQSLKGKSPAEIAAQLADQAVGAGLQAGQQLLAQIATAISPDLGQAAGAIIPYVGWIVQMLLDAKPAGNVASVQSYTAGAFEMYQPIGQAGHSPGFGTGPGGQLLPVDLLIRKELAPDKQTGARRFQYTSMGQALAAMTEYSGPRAELPLARRAVFRSLRRQIVASYNRLSDGGAALWTVYLDLLRHAFDTGALTPTKALYLNVFGGAYNAFHGNAERDGSCYYATWGMDQAEYHDHEVVTDKLWSSGKNAAQQLAVERNSGAWTYPPLFDSRSRQQIYDTVQGWRQTLAPKYVQFQTLETKVLEYLKTQGKPKIVLKLPAKTPFKVAPQIVQAAAKTATQSKALQTAVASAAAAWTKQAGPLPALPHAYVPQAVPTTAHPTGPIPTVVPGLSFQITKATEEPRRGLAEAAPVAAGAAALLLLL